MKQFAYGLADATVTLFH